MEGTKLYFRIGILGLILLSVVFIFAASLYNLQIINGDSYLKQSERTIYKTESVSASRGEILDRNGRELVTNRLSYSVGIDITLLKQGDANAVLLSLVSAFNSVDQSYNDTLPIVEDSASFSFLENPASQQESRFARYAEEKGLVGKDASQVMAFFREEFEIGSGYTDEQARLIAGVRYELQLRELFTNIPAYTFAEDIDIGLVSVIKEQNFTGITVDTVPIREYSTVYAAHILGRVGPIFENEYAELKEQGYSLNAIIGKDGAEKAFETYLRGQDGKRTIETNTSGKITNVIDTVQAQPGDNIMLTIDLSLQEVAEKSLASNIQQLQASQIEENGSADAEGGSVVVLDIHTGEILAMASYPTYNLSAYSRDYNDLLSNELNPLLNRATMGTYAPGSTFKMVTAVGSLEEEVITPSTRILDRGVYMYYAPSYTPMCYLYRDYGRTHGNINVSDALRVSCNYFFYDVGRRLGIENIDEYAKAFGLGEPTGVEIPEYTGTLAGPEFSESVGAVWYPGNTLAAAIGQSDNAFTPLQLASYVATLANGGTRYRCHLLMSVKSYDYRQTILDVEPEALSAVSMSDTTWNAVMQGMLEVTETGTAAGYFNSYSIKVGAKTGSAQVGSGIANGVFVAFAPFDDPEIAIAIVVEHAGTGGSTAPIARDIFDAYFLQASSLESVSRTNALLR